MADDYNPFVDYNPYEGTTIESGDPRLISGDSGYSMPDDSEMGGSSSGIRSWDQALSNASGSSNFLSRIFSGNMTSGDKAGTLLGLGALAIAQSLSNKPPAIKQPVYKQAPVYNRALTAPMYGVGSLNPQTGKTQGQGMPLFFNPNPFQFDPTEAAKRYGPSPEQIAAGQQVYQQQMNDLYRPITVPDVQMTGAQITQQNAQQAQQQNAQQASQPVQGVETGMARGGFLKGNGDGMSDEIKATINDKQPARLSDGEFVIPADVVAHLGNGSSKAGAQKLYDMMARVRKARTGTDKQAPEINPSKFV
jgi:hypothetical protein